MAKTLDIIRWSKQVLDLELNIRKTWVFWSSCDDNNHCWRLFPLNIERPVLRVNFLEGVLIKIEIDISESRTRMI